MTDRYRGNLLLSEDLDTFIIQFIQFLTTEDPTITLTDANGNPIPVSSLSQVLGNSVAPSAVLAVAQDASDALSAAAEASGMAVSAASLGASAYDLASSASSDAAEALSQVGTAQYTANVAIEELNTNGPIVSSLQASVSGMAVTIAAVSAVADAATGSAAAAGAAAMGASGLAGQAESNALIASGLATAANANALAASGVGESALALAQTAESAALGASGYAGTAYSEAISAYALAGSALTLAEGAATALSVSAVRTTATNAASTAASALSVAETALSEASSALSILSSGGGGGGAATLPITPANGGTVIQYPGGAYMASDAAGTTLVTNDFFASDTVTVSGEGASLSVYTNSASSAALYVGNSDGTNIMFIGMGAHDDADPMGYFTSPGGLAIGTPSNPTALTLDGSGNTNVLGASLMVSGAGSSLSIYCNSALESNVYLGNSTGTNILYMGMGYANDADPMAYIESAGGLTIGASGNNQALIVTPLGNVDLGGNLNLANGNALSWTPGGTGIPTTAANASLSIGGAGNSFTMNVPAVSTVVISWSVGGASVASLDGSGNFSANSLTASATTPLASGAGSTTTLGTFTQNSSNGDSILIRQYRTVAGTSWTSSVWRIQRHVDATDMGYLQFGDSTGDSGYGSIGVGTSAAHTSWDSSGDWTFAGKITANGAGSSIGSATSSTGLTVKSTGSSYVLGVTDTGTNGAGIGFFGNGATTPNKYLRAASGGLQLVNSAYSGVLATFDDAGNLTMAAGVSASAFHAGYNSGTVGSVDCTQWFRSSGQTGWYAASYGIGVYCIDATYVRAYNGSQMYAADFVLSSDRRLKTAIRDFEYNGRLRPVNFFHLEKGHDDLGFISQEVQELYPELVGADPESGMLLLSYPKITTILSAQLNRLEDRVAAQDKVIDDLIAQLNNTPWKRFNRFVKGLFSRKGKAS